MKKIFTFVVAALAALTMQAETTTTVWTGNETADWSKRIDIPCTWNQVAEGDVLTFTAVTSGNSEGWASFHLLSGAWNQVVLNLSFPYEEGATKTTTFTMTAAALDSAINRGGLGVQGFGFTLTKIELTTNQAPAGPVKDLPEATLWTGEQTISGWGGNSLVINEGTLAPFKTAYTANAAANLYIRISGGTGNNVRISGQWGSWGETAFPSDGFNHAPAMDEDGVIKVELSADFVSKAFINNGGFAIWGDGGFSVKAIGTTKNSVMSGTTALENTAAVKNGVRYNLMGQPVDDSYRGVVILNGQTMLQ